ncbi:MAG: phospholipase [Verrucomicrobia bacterium]|nr:MAG: phospholipase [Verrucomicrobiota bacterium]
MPKKIKIKPQPDSVLQYLMFLPKDYKASETKRWPMILFLHGAGERGTDIWKVATHGPPKHVNEHPDFPFIVVSPQCAEDHSWSNDVLLSLLDGVNRKYRVDTNRVYLTGLSMGGYGTWNLGLAFPEKFAAIAPICGGGNFINVLLSQKEKTAAFKSLPIWAFHGAKDPVVPVSESERMVEAVKKAGIKEVKLTIYPEAQHDSWTQTYANPELYEWFLEHKR